MILADAYDVFLLDLDGVVWRGEQVVPGAEDAIAGMRARGAKIVFVTNNSSRTPRDYAMKLARMKIPTPPDNIVTSGHVVIHELRRIGLERGDMVHVCGGEGLLRLLIQDRFTPTSDETMNARAVVVGWNPKGTYDDIRKAANLVRKGLPFIASNLDATYPSEGQLLPGTGALVAAIEVASGRQCVAVGKPKPELFQLALERAGAQAFQALFVGDRPETDVVGAREAGLPCALVLTGVVAETGLGSMAAIPDVVLNDLSDVMRDLPHPRIVRYDREARSAGGGAYDREARSAGGGGYDREARSAGGGGGYDQELVAVQRSAGVGGAESELASIRVHGDDGTRTLRDLKIDAALETEASWRVVRRLLVDAVAGAERVVVSADVRPWVERIGVRPERDDGQTVLPLGGMGG